MKKLNTLLVLIFVSVLFVSCSDDDDGNIVSPLPTGNTTIYDLATKDVAGISGTATFVENTDASVTIRLDIAGTPADGVHPAHIHFNTAAEGGDIALSLEPVDGNTGESEITVSTLDDGTSITYSELLDFDGYINVHLSASEITTIVAQGDIGQNDLNGNTIAYDLAERAVPGISGSVTFSERLNGEALAEIALTGTPDGGEHPAHIHENTAAEGGDILFSFNAVDGTTGMSVTNVAAFDDGSALTYADIEGLDAYVNVHLSASEITTIVAQGDIGQNDLNGNTIAYDLAERAVPGISGSVTFSERLNGEALAEIALTGTPDGGEHPAHIHENTAAEGGDILFSFNAVDGTTGMSVTNVAAFDDGSALTYADIEGLDAYVNVHLSASEITTIVAQGDIGQNDLNGNTIAYDLAERAVPGISGSVTFSERLNGEALAEIALTGTPDGGEHPAHIHENTAAEGGDILFSFNAVDGTTGMSVTNVAAFDDGSALTYTDIEGLDAYVNVHLSASEITTIVAQGDIGQNDLTGESKEYSLAEKDVPGISGTATFFQRVNNTALAVLDIQNTPDGGMHPAHIHNNDAATGGGIAFSFNDVNGDTGLSSTQVETLDDDTAINYDDILSFNGYINVHLSISEITTIVAQGNIGSNE